jgi:steroid delta-isomerase-like uncharacterized protein
MKKIIIVTILFLSTGITYSQTMPEEEMKVLIENYVKALSDANVSQLNDLLSPNLEHHEVDHGQIMGFEDFKSLVSANKTAYPDNKITIDELIISGNKAVVRFFTSIGTNTGPLANGEPATGKTIKWSGATICHVVGGKISKEWVYYNTLPILTQFGYTIIPPKEKGEQ